MTINPAESTNRVIALVSRAGTALAPFDDEEITRINPKWTMVARVFISALRNKTVLSRLAAASSVNELKGILFVDAYLSVIRDVATRQHIRDLIADPRVSLQTLMTYMALTYARQNVCVDGDAELLYYTIEGAAQQLGCDPATLYRGILAGNTHATLILERTEVERLAQSGTHPDSGAGGL